MRRDRINSSIEHLKVLLEKEFHKQQPNVKLEKADILEMAVNYLQQQKSKFHSFIYIPNTSHLMMLLFSKTSCT